MGRGKRGKVRNVRGGVGESEWIVEGGKGKGGKHRVGCG